MPSLLLGEPLLVLAGEMDTTRVEGKSMGPVKLCMGMLAMTWTGNMDLWAEA